MGFFKRRTTKSVGRNIGKSIRRTENLQKNLRTLRKEKEQRDKEIKVKTEIRKLKAERPSFFKKVKGGVKRFTAQPKVIRAAQARRPVRQARRRAPPRRIAPRRVVRRPTRQTIRKPAPQPQKQQLPPLPIGFENFKIGEV